MGPRPAGRFAKPLKSWACVWTTYARYTAVLRKNTPFPWGFRGVRGSNRARERTRTQTGHDIQRAVWGVEIRNAARRPSSRLSCRERSGDSNCRASGSKPERRLSGRWPPACPFAPAFPGAARRALRKNGMPERVLPGDVTWRDPLSGVPLPLVAVELHEGRRRQESRGPARTLSDRNAAEADTLVAVELHRPVHEQPSADAGRSNPWGPARTLGIPISILIR